MDTLSFLKTILPESGIKYVMRLVPREGKPDFPIHTVYDTAEELAENILAIDAKYDQHNTYYAMASFREAKVKTSPTTGRDYIVGRKQDNVQAVKSLWIDWDVGKANDAASYETVQQAMDDIKKYVKATGLPVPLIVSSGYGLHTYWVMTEEVSSDEWRSITALQRNAMRHIGVKFDPSRDMDSASVLRAPGCHNRKNGKDDKLVRVLKGEAHPLPPQEFKRILKGYCEANKLTGNPTTSTFGERPSWTMKGGGSLAAIDFNKKSYVHIALQHCGQMRIHEETGSDREPMWWVNTGNLKFFVDGDKFAHEHASKHEDYSYDATQAKLDNWEAGPPSCAKYKELNPAGCDGCKAKCMYPLHLGYDESVELPNLLEMVAEPDEESKAAVLEDADANGVPFCWPERYGFDREHVYQKVQDANGVWVDVPIASPLLYPVEQIRDEDGTFVLRMHMWVRGKVLREFMLPTKHTADPRTLKQALHAQSAHVINDKAMATFLSKYMTDIQKAQAETETYRQMGWKHDHTAWLIGDTLYTADDERKVVVSKKFPAKYVALAEKKGTKEQWIKAVDDLYNQPNGEPYQFAICAAFAAPLHELLGFSEWRGIPFAITTNESGFGKTTVNMIANSIWGNPEISKISNATPKAVLGIASAFNNVPFLMDEVTSYLSDPISMGDTLYALSNGRGRDGMTSEGALREQSPEWTGVNCMTGNRNVILQVSENKLNPEAIQLRVFEIDLDTYPRLTSMDKSHPDYANKNEWHSTITKTIVNECYGVVGAEYIKYIIKNKAEVKDRLRKWSIVLGKNMDGDATKERYYYHLITCVLAAGYYAKKLGFINFDLTALKHWCIGHVAKLRGAVEETRCTPQDHYARLMTDLTGQLLVTRNFDSLDGRTGKTESHKGPNLRGPVAGRYVIGDDKERSKLYVTVAAVQAWCFEHGVAYNALRRDFIREKIIRFGTTGVNRETGAVKVAIGRGVDGYNHLRNPWCVELNVSMAERILMPGVTSLDDARAQTPTEPPKPVDDDMLSVDL